MKQLLLLILFCFNSISLARSIYLNGIDVSSAKSQELKKVDVFINENGDLFIVAPQYQVNEEDTYLPLAKFIQGVNTPEHQQAKVMPQYLNKIGKSRNLPEPEMKKESNEPNTEVREDKTLDKKSEVQEINEPASKQAPKEPAQNETQNK